MAIFGLKFGKKKEGRSSNISKLRSPYLKSTPIPDTKKNRPKQSSRFIPTTSLKPRSSRAKRILAIFLSVGIISFIVYALYFSDYFLIRKYKVEEEGTIIETNDVINKILEEKIGGNLVLLNEDDLSKAIKSAQPEISKITISKIFPDTIMAGFEKFPAVANITDTAADIQKKFVADSQGLLIEENTENPNLPYIKMNTASLLEVRKTILPDAARSAERLTYIIQAINLFEEKFGIKITYAQFLVRERELDLFTEKGFYVMIDMEKDLNGQIDKLKKALSKLDIYTVPLLYIDLRISGTDYEKVIYKPKK
jgi:cell division septal protein FtsQ